MVVVKKKRKIFFGPGMRLDRNLFIEMHRER